MPEQDRIDLRLCAIMGFFWLFFLEGIQSLIAAESESVIFLAGAIGSGVAGFVRLKFPRM